MAERGEHNNSDVNLVRVNNARAIRETFGGRFSQEEAKLLLSHFDWDRFKTLQFLFKGEQDKIREILGYDAADVLGMRKDHVLKDLEGKNTIKDEVRLFACEVCQRKWWRRVPARKPVSCCWKCNSRFDPIPRDREWGIAEYQCSCGNEFTGFGVIGVDSPCYQCDQPCHPVKILPDRKSKHRQRRSSDTHSCVGVNCFHRAQMVPPIYMGPLGGQPAGAPRGRNPNRQPPVPECPHPKSTNKRVLLGSQLHVSTGSTVTTFLSQSDLETSYAPSLSDIEIRSRWQ